MSRRGKAYSLTRLSTRSGLAEYEVLATLERYREQGLAGLHEDRSGLWWLARAPKDDLWWRVVPDEKPAFNGSGPRPLRRLPTRRCGRCGEASSAASGFYCAGCHFAGWWGRWSR